MGISVSQRFLEQSRNISRAFEDQQLIAEDLIRIMRRTLKKIQTIYVKDLLHGLMMRNMGTPDVINHTNRMLKRENRQRERRTGALPRNTTVLEAETEVQTTNDTITHTRPAYNDATTKQTTP